MHLKRFEAQFFLGFLLCAFGLLVLVFLPVLNILVLGVTFTVLFRPLYLKLRKVIPKREWLAAIAVVVFAAVVILAPLTFFGVTVFGEAQGLYAQLASGNDTPLLHSLHDQVQRLVPWFTVDLGQYAKQILGLLVNNLGLILSELLMITGTFFLSLFSFFYFLKDSGAIKNAIMRISPLSSDRTEEILSKLRDMVSSVLKGSLVIAVIEGMAVGLGFLVFNLANPALWGLVSIVAALVPVIGIALVVIPSLIVLALQGGVISMIGFGLWILVVVAVMENFLRPRLIRRNTKVHPLLILLSVLGGISFFGIMGFLLGPLVLSLFLALLNIYPAVILERDD